MISTKAIIHQTAIIEDGAVIEENVNVGPYCIIGKEVILKKGVILKSHVCIDGKTVVGENTIIYPFASLGQNPQDLKFEGENAETFIGENCTIREYVTIQKGTKGGSMKTVLGNNCLLMVGVHLAHDCIVGNNVIMANYVSLAGHVTVEDHVIIGGLSAVHQHTKIGKGAMIGGMSGVGKDVIPFANISHEAEPLAGLNLLGLKRAGFKNSTILELQKTYESLFEDDTKNFEEKVSDLLTMETDNELIITLKAFLQQNSKRRFCMPKKS